jgi:large subunit ribosomal protein L10
MSKTRVQKTELLNEYKEILKNKGGYLLVNSDKTDTKTVTGLKIKLKDVGANYEVVKNSIFKIALQETEQPLQVQDFDGPTAIIFFDEDPTAPAKLVKEMQKATELLDARSGVYEVNF